MVDFKLTKTDKTSDLVETNLSYHRKDMSDRDKDNNDDDEAIPIKIISSDIYFILFNIQ